jgi:hypothetical protein
MGRIAGVAEAEGVAGAVDAAVEGAALDGGGELVFDDDEHPAARLRQAAAVASTYTRVDPPFSTSGR